MIVMKFGGTSVEDSRAIERLEKIARQRSGEKPVVVVSAMSKVTDQLLATARKAGDSDVTGALDSARALRERHYAAAGELLGTGVFTEFHAELETEFDALDALIKGIAAVGELTPRTLDNVVSYGERLSSKLVTAALSQRGLNASHVDSRTCLMTDETFTKAIPDFEATNLKLQKLVKPLIEHGRIPVMGGFIGATSNGITTTLGRGGSDFSAAIIGAGLEAERIEIWTDVDGMMTTDPNVCDDARRIKQISFSEAAELAYFGAKVLHPATLLPAIRKNIPVLVLNSRNPSNEGTRITSRVSASKNVFKAIAAKKRITIVDVVATRMLMAHGYLRQIFEVFDRHKCPVDMVSTSEVSVSLTVDSNEAIPAIAADLLKLADVKYEGRKAIICLVGENIRAKRGIAAEVFSAIPDVNVRMISQGASEINISFVIEEDDVPRVIQALHKKFFADVDPEFFGERLKRA
jgi:aspartate kinase